MFMEPGNSTPLGVRICELCPGVETVTIRRSAEPGFDGFEVFAGFSTGETSSIDIGRDHAATASLEDLAQSIALGFNSVVQ